MYKKTSVAEPEPVEPKLFETRSRNDLLNKKFTSVSLEDATDEEKLPFLFRETRSEISFAVYPNFSMCKKCAYPYRRQLQRPASQAPEFFEEVGTLDSAV